MPSPLPTARKLRSGREVPTKDTHTASEETVAKCKRKLSSYQPKDTSSDTLSSPFATSKSGSSIGNREATLFEKFSVSNLPTPYILNEYLEVFSTPNAGRGVRTRIPNIFAGTLLLSETPLIREFPVHSTDDGDQKICSFLSRLKQHVAAMSSDERQQFVWLTPGQGRKDNEINCMASNAFGDWHIRSVYAKISFMNHSCRPNAAMLTDEDEYAEVRACVDLPQKGTEISIDYFLSLNEGAVRDRNVLKMVEDKKEVLKKRWKFDCACGACVDPKSTNAERKRLNELETKLNCHFTTLSKLPPVNVLEELIDEYIRISMRERLSTSVLAAHRTASRVYAGVPGEMAAEKELRHRTLFVEAVRVKHGAMSLEYDKAAEELGKALKRRRDAGSCAGSGSGSEWKGNGLENSSSNPESRSRSRSANMAPGGIVKLTRQRQG
jgi:hypothetical protein